MALTMAIDRYDRHVPFFNGTVTPPSGIEITPFEVGESDDKRDGSHRHVRMLRDLEWDIAEISLASFITEKTRNPGLPIVGVPVFPRRLFSCGQLWVNTEGDIREPAELIGGKVGCHAFQVTLSVLAKGDLKFEYGVPWESMSWVTMRDEAVPIRYPAGVSVEPVPEGKDAGKMLVDGELDAVVSPNPPQSMRGHPRIKRLFADARAEDTRYFEKYRYYPIMHLLGVKTDAIDREPELARVLIDMFDAAKTLAYQYYNDPAYALVAWSRNTFEDQCAALGDDPWPNGLGANRANLERFIMYCHDQGLTEREVPVEALFHDSVLDS